MEKWKYVAKLETGSVKVHTLNCLYVLMIIDPAQNKMIEAIITKLG